MRTAEPARSRSTTVFAAALVAGVGLALGLAPAAFSARHGAIHLPPLWAVEVTKATTGKVTRASMSNWRAAGVNAVIIDQRLVTRRQAHRLDALARIAGIGVLWPFAPPRGSSSAAVGRICNARSRKHPEAPCAVVAHDANAAQKLVRTGAADLVVLSQQKPQLLHARARPGSGTRLLLLPKLPTGKQLSSAWRGAVAAAATNPDLDLAVALRPGSARALHAYLRVLAVSKKKAGGDLPAQPSAPTGGAAAPGGGGAAGGGSIGNGGGSGGKTGGGGKTAGGGSTSGSSGGATGGGSGGTTGGGGATGGGGPAGSGTLWVGASGSCTRAAAAAAYGDATACGSLQAAYAACQPGDTVRIRAGSYGTQRVSGSKGSPGCVFVADSGTTIASLDLAASWFEIDDATIGDYSWNRPNPLPSHVTFRNITTSSEVFMKGGSDISIIGGSIGGFCSNGAPAGMHIEGEVSSGTTISNVLVDGVRFHDISRCPSGDHLEVIRIDENASNVTIRRSRFVGNDPNTSTIFVTNTDTEPGDPHDITIENNFFAKTPNAYYAIATQRPVIQTCTNIRIRYNSFAVTPLTTACSSGPGSVFKGNVAPRDTGSCPSAFAFSFNVWQSNTNNPCTGTDKVVIGSQFGSDKLGFVGAGSGDLHLAVGSPAVNAGDPRDYPSDDIDGASRPRGSAPDAGAQEAG